MNLGLPWLTQLRGAPPSTVAAKTPPDQQGQAVTTDDQGRTQTVGGWTALTFQQLVAAITVAWDTEHNADNSHGTIHATGSLAERGRTTALGEWLPVPYVATNFSTSGTAVWTVPAATVFSFAYTLIGMTMLVTFAIDGSALSVATASYLTLQIPGHATAARLQMGTFGYDDNGTRGTGVAVVQPTSGGAVIGLYKDIRSATTWSVSGNLAVFGQLAFELRTI